MSIVTDCKDFFEWLIKHASYREKTHLHLSIKYDSIENMKKSIIAAVFLLLPFFSSASFSKDLYYGVRGDAEGAL
jgi:hypothetical protein